MGNIRAINLGRKEAITGHDILGIININLVHLGTRSHLNHVGEYGGNVRVDEILRLKKPYEKYCLAVSARETAKEREKKRLFSRNRKNMEINIHPGYYNDNNNRRDIKKSPRSWSVCLFVRGGRRAG